MIPFFDISEADLAEWRRAMGVPEGEPIPLPPIECEICQTPIDQEDSYVECEAPPPGTLKRRFHSVCLTMHMIKNEDNLQDEITNFVTRKPICNTETPSSSSQITSSEDIEDASLYGGL